MLDARRLERGGDGGGGARLHDGDKGLEHERMAALRSSVVCVKVDKGDEKRQERAHVRRHATCRKREHLAQRLDHSAVRLRRRALEPREELREQRPGAKVLWSRLLDIYPTEAAALAAVQRNSALVMPCKRPTATAAQAIRLIRGEPVRGNGRVRPSLAPWARPQQARVYRGQLARAARHDGRGRGARGRDEEPGHLGVQPGRAQNERRRDGQARGGLCRRRRECARCNRAQAVEQGQVREVAFHGRPLFHRFDACFYVYLSRPQRV